jgi:hypothetical protein
LLDLYLQGDQTLWKIAQFLSKFIQNSLSEYIKADKFLGYVHTYFWNFHKTA